MIFAIIHHMEGRHIVEDKLLSRNHNVVMYLENHTELHLGDVLFYNMAAQLRKAKITRHTDAYFEVNLGLRLFPENVVALFFHQMMQFASSLAPLSKSEVLPPRNSPFTPPLQGISKAEHASTLAEFWAQAQGENPTPFNQQPPLKSRCPHPAHSAPAHTTHVSQPQL